MEAITSSLVAALLLIQSGAAFDRPVNPGFEEGEQAEFPGWSVPSTVLELGYRAELSTEMPFDGERCATLWYGGEGEAQPFGNLMQSLDASAWRGKAFRFRAAVRVEGSARTQLWFRVDRPGGTMGFFDNMSDRPIRSAEWDSYEIRGEVAPDAVALYFGLILSGEGQAFLDAVELEPIELALPEPARPLAERGLANLVAFARLLGYVRHFHPSDEAAEASWDELAVAGVRAVERAQDADELVAVLARLFAPVAPTVRVVLSGETPEEPASLQAPEPSASSSVTWWTHLGYGTGREESMYRSQRQTERLRDGDLPDGCRDPADTLEAELGAGVSASIPLALYADEQGTLPHQASAPSDAARTATLEASAPLATGDDRATRLAGVILAWNVFQHFYPYFDVVDTDWARELDKALRAAAEDHSEQDFLETLRELVAALHDGHGNVSHRSDRRWFGPPLCWDWVEGELVITHVPASAGPPAAGSDEALEPPIERGSVVLSIDGVPTAEAFERARRSISGATEQGIRRESLAWLAAGSKDSAVVLVVRAPDGAERTLTYQRSVSEGELAEPRPETLTELEPGIVYIDLESILDEEFEAAVPRLQQARGIVFDVRGYPHNGSKVVLSHLIDEPIQSPRWNFPVVTLPDRQGFAFDEIGRWWVEPLEPRLQAKVAFLTDGRAISYAETYLGMVEHYELGEIVGGPTAGTNGNINPFWLPGKYYVNWTGMQVLKHDGSQHHGVGIQPTIPCSRTIAGVTAGRDEVLERGVAAVRD